MEDKGFWEVSADPSDPTVNNYQAVTAFPMSLCSAGVHPPTPPTQTGSFVSLSNFLSLTFNQRFSLTVAVISAEPS